MHNNQKPQPQKSPPQQSPIPLPQHLQQHLKTLTQAITQKNQIIEHLTSRIHNQQKQIDMLVLDAEEKHFHQITKYYMKSINKYMKYDKYLLVKIDGDDVGNDFYMSKFVKIVHFGELEVVGGGVGVGRRYEQGERELWGKQGLNSNQNVNRGISGNNVRETENQGNGKKQPNVVGLKQVNMNKQESNSFQLSCKGLSLQIQELKQKLKAYTTMVTQKSASRMQKTDKKQTDQKQKSERSLKNKGIQPENIPQFSPNNSLTTPFQKLQPLNQNSPSMSQSEKKIQGLQLKTLRDKKKEWNQEVKDKDQQQVKDKQEDKDKKKNIECIKKDVVDVSAFHSDISPLKKKGNTKTIFIRKR